MHFSSLLLAAATIASVDPASAKEATVVEDVARLGALGASIADRNVKHALGLRPRNRKRGTPLATAPSGSYAPTNSTSDCPENLIRNGTVVSPSEADWVDGRRSKAVDAWRSYLSNGALQMGGFDVSRFLSNTSNIPNVGLAASGGGYRAMLYEGGLINAFDGRNSSSVQQGTGGILQLATYFSGLSGGSWLVGSVALNDFPTIWNLRDTVWNLTEDLVNPGGVIDLVKYYTDLHGEVEQKDKLGYDVSLTDYWGRALSRHLINRSDNGIATTWSSIQQLSSFTNHDQPFPIIMADGRAPGQKAIPANTTIWEFNPFEFGSRNPDISAYIPMQFLGTYAYNGKPNNSQCTYGYDNAGFVMGTSATLFNSAILTLANSTSTIANILGNIVQGVLGAENDIATYPNTFEGVYSQTFKSSREAELDLVDGGEDLENIPIWPLLHQERNVDVVVAMDSSGDIVETGWPNGASIVATGQRLQDKSFAQYGSFPHVPNDTNTFINRGLNDHTTFFGCNETTTPLVVYVPNHPYISYTNFSYLQLSYTELEQQLFLDNGLHVASGNGTAIASNTPTLPTCLACAFVHRGEQRLGMEQTDACKSCFSAYCWDGVSDSSTPSKLYAPTIPGVDPSKQVGGAGLSTGKPPQASSDHGDGVALSPSSSFSIAGALTALGAVLLAGF